jgi:uncharacterized membrane protein
MNKKYRNLNILANILMIIGLIFILIPIIYFVLIRKIISADISFFGIIIGLIGIYISKKVNKN